MNTFKVGDEVIWKSQAAGSWKEKVGEVVYVVPKGNKIPKKFSPDGTGWPRSHVSFVVMVGKKLYWPRVSALKMHSEVQLFYVQDTRQGGTVGNAVSWWAKNKAGYTCHLDKAHVFKAADLRGMRDTDRPWPKKVVDEVASLHVDHQNLPIWTGLK